MCRLVHSYPTRVNATSVSRAMNGNARQGLWDGAPVPLGNLLIEVRKLKAERIPISGVAIIESQSCKRRERYSWPTTRVKVAANGIRIVGDKASLKAAITGSGSSPRPDARSSVRNWRTRHDSNV